MVLPLFFHHGLKKIEPNPCPTDPLSSFLTKKENSGTAFQSFLAKVNCGDEGCWEWARLQQGTLCEVLDRWDPLYHTVITGVPPTQSSLLPPHDGDSERDVREVKWGHLRNPEEWVLTSNLLDRRMQCRLGRPINETSSSTDIRYLEGIQATRVQADEAKQSTWGQQHLLTAGTSRQSASATLLLGDRVCSASVSWAPCWEISTFLSQSIFWILVTSSISVPGSETESSLDIPSGLGAIRIYLYNDKAHTEHKIY